MAPHQDVISRIVAAHPADGAAMVLDLPGPQARAVLAALGPRQVARLLRGVRADRVAELLGHIGGALPGVLAQLTVPEIAAIVPLVPIETAVRIATHLPPDTAAELLMAVPTQHRIALQRLLPQPVVPPRGYADQAEQAIRRTAGTLWWRDPRGTVMVTEVFGRPIQVVVHDRPGAALGAADLHAAIGATDWRRINGLLVLTNATLDVGLGAALREARQHGYVVEAVQWQDERDDGLLKRALVRLSS